MHDVRFTQQQIKHRVARIVALTERALVHPQPGSAPSLQVVDQLGSIAKRCSLLHNLLQLDMRRGELDTLIAQEIDFIRCAELFLDKLGIRHGHAPGVQESKGLV